MASEQQSESPRMQDTQEWVEPLPEKVPEATFRSCVSRTRHNFPAFRNSKFICIFRRRPGADRLVDRQVDRRALGWR